MSKKKVALMTWYQYENYGSVLQAASLYSIIKKTGFCPTMIQYVPRGNREVIPDDIIPYYTDKFIRKIIGHSYTTYTSVSRTALFNKFSKKIFEETDCVKTFPELADFNDTFDAFICGSDQIWSPLCFDENYFFPFVDDSSKLIAYAPSLGVNSIENKYIKERIRNLTTRFAHLSCREEQGVHILKELTGKNVEHVLDPTLLLNSSDWEILMDKTLNTNIIQGKYIICYFLGDSHKYDKFVSQLSKKLKIPFWVIPQYTYQKNDAHSVPFEVGPAEFISLLKNASFVCTDSFHGTIFAMNFNVPFYTLRRFKETDPRNQNSRVESILKKTLLDSRLVDYTDSIDEKEILPLDFSKMNKILDVERVKSLKYLQNALIDSASKMVLGINKNATFKITEMCCGCGACAAICPTKAIRIVDDEKGFQHYRIAHDKCIRCASCKSVCPFNDIKASSLHYAQAMYSYQSTDMNSTIKSSSGGIGFDLSKVAMQKGFKACGCAYDTKIQRAKHIIINQEKELSLLQGSKYIQSISALAIQRLVDTVKKNKRMAIFFGTPCEAAGVDKLFRKKGIRENIIIVDLICHGVPTNLLWQKYLKDICSKYDLGREPFVSFRGSHGKWVPLNMTISHVSGQNKYENSEMKDDFYAFFRRGLCYMDTCYECPYRERSAADIRIGDYWGTRFSDQIHGVSMVIANTLQGKKCITEWKLPAKIVRQDLNEYWSIQYPYNHSKPLVYNNLMTDLKKNEESISVLRKRYCSFYDISERIGKFKNLIKGIINKKKNERKI